MTEGNFLDRIDWKDEGRWARSGIHELSFSSSLGSVGMFVSLVWVDCFG